MGVGQGQKRQAHDEITHTHTCKIRRLLSWALPVLFLCLSVCLHVSLSVLISVSLHLSPCLTLSPCLSPRLSVSVYVSLSGSMSVSSLPLSPSLFLSLSPCLSLSFLPPCPGSSRVNESLGRPRVPVTFHSRTGGDTPPPPE